MPRTIEHDQKTLDREDTEPLEPADENRDPITGAPGSHPVGTGLGAAGGGAAGVAVGAAVGGPVGGLVGGAVGAIVGGLTGKAAAEKIDPTVEADYWRNEYRTRPYARDETWETYEPAYRYGWESRARYQEERWDDVEPRLESDWREHRGDSSLGWDRAKHATRDAWDRLSSWFDPDEEDRYWRESHATRPYVGEGDDYETYAPAYRFGWEAKRRHPTSRWEDAESRTEREWNELEASSRLGWERAKHAVRDAWHRVEHALPGDLDRDGR
jgi:hypothetical protein